VTSDNKYIASGSGDKTIGVWDIARKYKGIKLYWNG